MTTFMLDSSDLIQACADFHRRSAVYLRELISKGPQSHFTDQYTAIYACAEEFQNSTDETRPAAYLSYVSTVLQQSDFAEATKKLHAIGPEMANVLLSSYNDDLDKIFIGQPFESQQSKYCLGADLHASQYQRIQQAFHNYLIPAFTQLQELREMREFLFSNCEIITKSVNGGFDIAVLAKAFSLGLLAYSIPVVGIPAALANIKRNSDQNTAKKNQIALFEEQFEKYLALLNDFTETLPKCLKAAADWMHHKFSDINVNAISQILTDLTQAGYSIDHYQHSLDYTALAEAEQQLQSNDTP